MRVCFALIQITHDGTKPNASSIAELQGATAPLTLEVKMPEAHGRRLRVSGCENLEWATLACLSDANFRQALPLCLVRAFVDLVRQSSDSSKDVSRLTSRTRKS